MEPNLALVLPTSNDQKADIEWYQKAKIENSDHKFEPTSNDQKAMSLWSNVCLKNWSQKKKVKFFTATVTPLKIHRLFSYLQLNEQQQMAFDCTKELVHCQVCQDDLLVRDVYFLDQTLQNFPGPRNTTLLHLKSVWFKVDQDDY